jgi:hypothetical protein
VCYTPKGLAYYSDWGTLRNTGNMMFVASLMYKYGANKQANICFARNQMRYILGSDTGKSYLIGFGTNQPLRPHHRQSACSARYTEPCTPFNGGTCCVGESGAPVLLVAPASRACTACRACLYCLSRLPGQW